MIVGQMKPSLEELAHVGVRGMRWGVRKNDSTSAKPGLIIQPGLSKEKEAALKKHYSEGVKSGQYAKGPIVKPKTTTELAVQNALAAEHKRQVKIGAIRAALILAAVGTRITIQALTGADVSYSGPTTLEGV